MSGLVVSRLGMLPEDMVLGALGCLGGGRTTVRDACATLARHLLFGGARPVRDLFWGARDPFWGP